MLEQAGVSIEANGHRTLLKWHRGHRFAGDVSFTRERIAQGMACGASVEIDLVRFADAGFAVLHDETLDRPTTGQGPVLAATAYYLRSLRLRDHQGAETGHPIMLIDDLGPLLEESAQAAGAVLQLDLKERSADIRDADIAAFAEAITPVAKLVILSGGDAVAVERLSQAVPDMPIGYDPCHEGAMERLMESRDFEGFVATALAASPRAEMIYLHHKLVLFADSMGFDLINAFHAEGRRIDAYTINKAIPGVVPDVLRLLALKADQITTDDPVGLQQLLADRLSI